MNLKNLVLAVSVAVLSACSGDVATSTVGNLEVRPSVSTSDLSIAVAPSGETFAGLFNNQAVGLTVSNPQSTISVDFDLYLIGSWDGSGKQAQHGNFGTDLWQVGYRCGNGSVVDVFTTSFSNQKTVTQHYPESSKSNKTHPAWTGATSVNALQYSAATTNVPLFNSYGDSEYHLSFSWRNTCGTDAVSLVFGVPNGLQPLSDESWGIDNLVVN
jgi:hypothetical protein